MVTVGTISSPEQVALARDAACFLGRNYLRDYQTAPEWSTALTWATGGSGGGTNVSLSTFPPRYVYDGHGHLRSTPTNTSSSAFYLLFDLDNAINEIDAVAIVGHNFDELLGTVTVTVGMADNSAYSTNLRSVKQWSSASFGSQRLVSLDLSSNNVGDLGEYRRFTDVRYAYLLVSATTSMGSGNPRPQIGEVFLGRRRQLARFYNHPDDDLATASNVDDFVGEGGGHTRYIQARGYRDYSATWTADEQDAIGIDDIAAWRAFFGDDIEDGTRSFLYCRRPSSDPQDAPLMYLPTPRQAIRYEGSTFGDIEHAFKEKRPFLSREAA